MVRQERQKDLETKLNNYVPDGENNDKEGDETYTRDKPKRYSSQRQKPGASLLDIPGELEENLQYYDMQQQGQQQIYNTKVAVRQQQQHQPQQQQHQSQQPPPPQQQQQYIAPQDGEEV